MKKIFLISAITLIIFALQSCEKDDLPHPDSKAVENTFKTKYSNATQVEWEKKGKYWVADFYYDSKEREAWFETNGTWRMTETDIAYGELTKMVKTAFSTSSYQTWQVGDVDMVERPGTDSVYVLEVESGNKEYDLYYASDGTLVKAVEDTWHNDNDSEKYLL